MSEPPAPPTAAAPAPAEPPPSPALPAAPLPVPPRKGHVRAEPLAVSPALLGRKLGGPGRRAAALLIDLAMLGLLSALSSWALAAALLLLAALVHQALVADGARAAVARGVAGVLVLAALAVAWASARPPVNDDWQREVGQALEASESLLAASDAASATAALREATAALPASAPGVALLQRLPAIAASAAAEPAAGPAPDREAELRRLVERLEDLQREHRPPSLADRLDAAVAELGLGFGWGIVYFSLLPALWPGRTVGKALLRLRIVELSGRPLTPLRALKRYGGYAAGIATGGLGFAQALWDPNRQCLHDKAAHTVVLDLRGAAPAP